MSFLGRMMFLLLNTLFVFPIAFLPRSKCLLISWLQAPSTVVLEAQVKKSVTASTFSPSICHEGWGWIHDLSFLIFNVNCDRLLGHQLIILSTEKGK